MQFPRCTQHIPQSHPEDDPHPLPLGGEGEQLEDVVDVSLASRALCGHGGQVSVYQSQTHTLCPLHQRYLWGGHMYEHVYILVIQTSVIPQNWRAKQVINKYPLLHMFCLFVYFSMNLFYTDSYCLFLFTFTFSLRSVLSVFM